MRPVLVLLIASLVSFAQGQRYPGAAPQAPPQANQPQVNGPLSLILGPVGDVKRIYTGDPKAPSTDTIYNDLPIEEWPPDEFISNPDHEFDWHDLKGWHYPPTLKSITLLGNRKVKAGDTIRYEAIVEDVTGTPGPMPMTIYGPHGRRTTLSVRFTSVTPGSNVMRGSLTVPKWAEPGLYWSVDITPQNDTRHSKGYYVEDHPGLKNLEFEVAPNTDADVIPPRIEWVKLNLLDAPADQIRTQRIQYPIPVFAKVTDNKSGVKSVTIRLSKLGTNHFIESRLNKIIGQPDVFGAMLSVPQWWEGGEYKMLSMWAEDNNDQQVTLLQTTHPVLKNANIILTQDPANVDKTPPQLLSVWVDKTAARLGDTLTVNAIITDDKSGVGTVAVMFAPHPSYIDRVRIHLKPVERPAVVQKSGMDISGNLWTGTFESSVWYEPGEWRVDRITARDNADNYMDLLPEYHPELSDVKINFTGGNNLREQLTQYKKGIAAGPGRSETAPTVAPAPAAPAAGKIRRVDMTPPHPPRGACLNCHEP